MFCWCSVDDFKFLFLIVNCIRNEFFIDRFRLFIYFVGISSFGLCSCVWREVVVLFGCCGGWN